MKYLTKKNIFLLLFAFCLTSLFYLFYNIKPNKPIVPTTSPVPFVPYSPNKSQTILFEENTGGYKISYFSKTQEYLISVLKSPFSYYRTQAEIAFLKEVGIASDEACLKKITITTPSFINPEEAGQIYKLSYCK
jgi:hypothetical protein